MQIVKPTVEVFFHEFPGHTSEEFLEKVGRTCYKSEDKITTTSAERFIRMLNERGHKAMLEHSYASAKFVCDRGTCYSADTDVLTDEGWKCWSEICGDEKFITLNNAGKIEYQYASAIIEKDYEGPMYLLQTSLINLCITPDHNVFIQKFDTQAAKRGEELWQLVPIQEIAGKRVSYKRNAFPIIINGVEFVNIPDFVTTQGNSHGGISPHTRKGRKYSAINFAKFFGYWLAEGSLSHSKGGSYRIDLFQNSGPVFDHMVSIIKEMGYKPDIKSNGKVGNNKRISICDVALYQWLKPYSGSKNKRIPRDLLNSLGFDALSSLLDCYIAGDGSVHWKTRHRQAYTISRRLADDLQEIALKLGISATIWVDDRVGEMGGLDGLIHRHICYVVSFVTEKNTPLVNHGGKTFRGNPHEMWVSYSGKVYCATVLNHILYVRRNGRPCWSGNSHELVRHRIVSFAQESTRYCDYTKAKFGDEGIAVIKPVDMSTDPVVFPEKGGALEDLCGGIGLSEADIWNIAMLVFDECYHMMRKAGSPPQRARHVLPIGLKTEIWASTNLREWQHIFELRCSDKAHPHIRYLMLRALAKFAEWVPTMFEDLWVAFSKNDFEWPDE